MEGKGREGGRGRGRGEKGREMGGGEEDDIQFIMEEKNNDCDDEFIA